MRKFFENLYYFFPVQLLLLHLKKNQILVLCWVFLFILVSGGVGSSLGIHFLFLDPEYLNQVNFWSFFIVGITLSGLSVAFHITSYIIDGHRFTFLGALPKPFTKFSVNNSIIPISFLVLYILYIIKFQISNQFASPTDIVLYLLGLNLGYISLGFPLYLYFRSTNKDIFKYVVCKVDEKLKRNIKATRGSALSKLNIAKKKQIRVDHYFTYKLEVQKVDKDDSFYDKSTILQVFDQNHLNLVIIELVIFLMIMAMGIFKDIPSFQIPAAASVFLFLSIFVMFTGAFTYWFRGWSISIILALIILLNFLVKTEVFKREYRAFGLDYKSTLADYSLSNLRKITRKENYDRDKTMTTNILNNWRKKFEDTKPKMVFICVSGGGQRASLWTMQALQHADSATGGLLMKNTMLITGASGGLIGASYFRELYLKKQLGDSVNLLDQQYRINISNDNLNPIIFSLLANDLFVNLQRFEYSGISYPKDRGYSFERHLNKNTNQIMEKPLTAYLEPEADAIIPMLIIAPTIVNDGRKLFISPHQVSYMNMSGAFEQSDNLEIEGIDFLTLFKDQGAKNLRFLSALRMSASFPYITPSITLPSNPPMLIMDAGISDNFGISDAIRFLYAFRDWISEHTSGVIILSIRDSLKDGPIAKNVNLSLFEKFSTPISNIYKNFENMQDINNDSKLEFSKSWYSGDLIRIDMEYIPPIEPNSNIRTRASLNWRLTSREKKNIEQSIHNPKNIKAMNNLRRLLESKGSRWGRGGSE